MSGGGVKTVLAMAGVLGLALATPAFAATSHGSHHRHAVAAAVGR